MELREKLAVGCRILGTEGHNDFHLGHVSAREPGAQVFLMKPHALCLDEIQPEDLITLNLQYQKVAGERPQHGELPIHIEIFKRRPDINCVIHTHPQYTSALSATRARLRPVNNDGVLFARDLPYFDLITDLIVTEDMGVALADKLGDDFVVILKNHGIVVAGPTIEIACIRAVLLERAAKSYFIATQFGEISWTDDEEARRKAERIFTEEKLERFWGVLVRRLKRREMMTAPRESE